MGHTREFTPAKLVIGVLISRTEHKETLLARLEALFGFMDYESPILDFTWTDYYDEEMGRPIYRFFVSFGRLVAPEELVGIKIATNALEEEYSVHTRRVINLDPGLLSLSRFVLATTKENAHRIALSKGIFADLTLLYRKNGFQPLEWTYPDFRSPEYHAILLKIRSGYKDQLNREGGLPRF